MPNNYFEFKHFRIEQNDGVFKVGTDACLLGAMAEVNQAKTILDVGTGTGVIALMLAQRNQEANITAIEPQDEAFEVAKRNIQRSRWSNRIEVKHSTLQEFSNARKNKFDLIVSNPPFFKNSLVNPDHVKRMARHEETLTIDELLSLGKDLLSQHGQLYVIIPTERKNEIIAQAHTQHLHLNNEISIQSFIDKDPHREIVSFVSQGSNNSSSIVVIYTQPMQYTPEMIGLMKPFYKYL